MRILVTIVLVFFMLIAFSGYAGPVQDSIAVETGSTQAVRQTSSERSVAPVSVQQSAAGDPQVNTVTFPEKLSLPAYLTDSVSGNVVHKLLKRNQLINTRDVPVFRLSTYKKFKGKEWLFYLSCGLLLILGIFKTFFRSYFNNLFLIFFNTSLRQSQLTDQLSQAKLPSFILNIFFVLSGGTYIWLLFLNFDRLNRVDEWMLLPLCILSVTLIYFFKYILLKFTGWLAGIQPVTNIYIFIIFLVNKIMGILLIPFIILLAFAGKVWVPAVATISALLIGLLFISRYFKSFSALETRLQINTFHLLIFVIAVEILPLLILYKVVTDYLV